MIRQRLTRFRGKELDTAGDGFFATFDGPARAIRCASAITDAVREIGLEVRAGLHTGECELMDGKVTGIAVNIGARVAAQAAPSEVLVSSTVKDLVAGSGIEFEDRGAAELKGVPGHWQLYAVQGCLSGRSPRPVTPAAATSGSPTRPSATVRPTSSSRRVRLEHRARLVDPRPRGVPRGACLLRAGDPVRQARHRHVRPGPRARLARDADGRCSGGDGRGAVRAGHPFGIDTGGMMSIVFAATYPERTTGLILSGTAARTLWAPDHPWGPSEAEYLRSVEEEERRWGSDEHGLEVMRRYSPTLDTRRPAWAAYLRQSASPGAYAAYRRMNMENDVRGVLPAIHVPTVVAHRAGDDVVPAEAGRYLADRIAGARFVELPGTTTRRSPAARGADRGGSATRRRSLARPRLGGHGAGPRARHGPVHGHRGVDGEGGRAR